MGKNKCAKVTIAHPKAAAKVIFKIYRSHGRVLSPYWCPHCGKIHLTTVNSWD